MNSSLRRDEKDRMEIETLLLQYGAREFTLDDEIGELDDNEVSDDLSSSTHYPLFNSI